MVLAAALLLALTSSHAQVISIFDAGIAVDESGSAVVNEKLELQSDSVAPLIFEQRVPTDTVGPLGERYRIFFKMMEATDGDGHSLEHSAVCSGGHCEIKVTLPPGTRKLEITYALKNAVKFHPDQDVLYWNFTGAGWKLPIQNASFIISLPDSVAGKFRARGVVEGRALERQANGTAVSFDASDLAGRAAQTVIADVIFDKGALQEPNPFTTLGWFIEANPIVLMPLIVFGVMYGLWRVKGTDPKIAVVPIYHPPDGLTPAECGALLEDKVVPRDIVATLVDLAVRGYLRIEETTEPGLLRDSRDYILRLLKPMKDWDSLLPFEYTMLWHTFHLGEWTTLSSMRQRFYQGARIMEGGIMNALRDKGMYRIDPLWTAAFRQGILAVGYVVILELNGTGWLPSFEFTAPWIGALAVSALIVYLFSGKITSKTLKGVKAYAAVRGFQEFLNTVEKDHIERVPDSFKYLPYAIAMGIEHRWAGNFAAICKEPPDWYQSAHASGIFDVFDFSQQINGMARAVTMTFTLTPRGSSQMTFRIITRPGPATPPRVSKAAGA